MTRRAILAAVAAAVASGASGAMAAPVRVQVYADTNGDGVRQPDERAVAGVVVARGVAAFAVTDADGVATVDGAGADPGAIVWARVPEGYRAGAAWAAWSASGDAQVGLVPLSAPIARPLRFVVASDTHIAATQPFAHDLGPVARAAIAATPGAAMLVVLGDLAQGAQAEQYALVDAQLAGLGVPVVRVPGNHDGYDGGAAWEARYGPRDYSFDAGGAHFVVWNMTRTDAEVRAFVEGDLARVAPGTPIIGLAHAPPSAALVGALRALGVTAILDGHLHGNRAVAWDGLRELNTEPLLMGGIDGTPAGYRVVTVDAGGVTSANVTVEDAVAPAPRCVAVSRALAIAAPALARLPPPRATLPPPLAVRWTADVDGAILTAAPVFAGDLVVVAVTDLGDGDRGGVVALDLATGAERWRVRTETPVRGAAAVTGDGGLAAVAQVDGTILGLDAATGHVRWRDELAVPGTAGAVLAGPTIDGDDVFVGAQRRFVAIDARTGRERWSIDPIPDAPEWTDFATLAPVAAAPDLVVGTSSREQSGVTAYDRQTGQRAWRIDEATAAPTAPGGTVDTLAIGIAAAPVIDAAARVVYLATSADEVAALDLDTGAVRWRTQLDARGFDWGAAILGTPVLARGVLVVPTLYDDVVALDAASGAEVWRHAAAGPSPLRVTHYRGAAEAGFAASPVASGDVVWLADTSGVLVALALETGDELWSLPLGAPVLAGLAARGDTLVVASFDGTVRALAPVAPAAVVATTPPCPPIATAPAATTESPRAHVSRVTALAALAALAIALAIAAVMRDRRLRRGPRAPTR